MDFVIVKIIVQRNNAGFKAENCHDFFHLDYLQFQFEYFLILVQKCWKMAIFHDLPYGVSFPT